MASLGWVIIDGVLNFAPIKVNGALTTTGAVIAGTSVNANAASGFVLTGNASLFSTGASQIIFANAAGTVGTMADVSTDATIAFKTRAAADTAIVASNQFKTTAALITSTAATTPTFGTNFVGGAGGPTTGAQNAWVKMLDSTGATIWIPVWK